MSFCTENLSDESSDEERPSFGVSSTSNLSNLSANNSYGVAVPPKKRFRMEDFQNSPKPEPENTTMEGSSLPKKMAEGDKSYSDFSRKLMAKMGHVEGRGLGKAGQGIVEPVAASKQKGRRGLGLELKGFEASDVAWQQEQISVHETVEWIPPCDTTTPSLKEMRTWIKEGVKKKVIDDETTFCSPDVVHDVLKCKSVFDALEGEEMRRARTRSNPFETIRGGIFQNRAAMKMANMDAVLDFMFTNPKDQSGRPVLGSHDVLYFADICAGPGGFSEYVLWRKRWHSKGFGFTLKGPCDFKLAEFHAAPSEMFEPHYGVNGLDGDGDIYRPDNLQVFRQFVLDNTDGKGVHFVMADGGFSVEGQENIQEILSKRLYLCQFLCALSILRNGGHFVCKLFDLFTPYSVGLVYLMYHAFEQVSIYKPVTSRPANSERYIVCKFKKSSADVIHDYMFEINLKLDQFSGIMDTRDITEVVPMEILKNDNKFFDYIYTSNDQLGKQQCIHLLKIQTFAQNTDLYEERQYDIRTQCLQLWQVPDQVRTAPAKVDATTKFTELTEDDDDDYFSHIPEELDLDKLESLKSIYDYKCILSGGKERMFLLGLGRAHIYKWDGRPNVKWRKLEDIKLELPKDTLIEGEIVQELKGEGKGQRRVMAFHITDALVLCGDDVRKDHFNERMDKARLFVKALSKASRPDLAVIRVKDVFSFERVKQIFDSLQPKLVKGTSQPKICYCGENGRHFVPTGLYCVKTVKDPWAIALSRSANRKYFYNCQTKQSVFEIPSGCISEVRSCMLNRYFWSWDRGVQVYDGQQHEDESKLSKDKLLYYMERKMGHER